MVWNPRRVVGVIGGVLFALAVEGPCAAQSIGSTTLQAEAAPASDVAVVEEDRLLAHLPDLDALRRSRLKKCTLFEMGDDDEESVRVQAEYMRLAETLYAGVEPSAPAPLEDREIFELLGFD